MADKTPDPQQEALFREVDEDLREEQMHRLWKQYGGYLIGVAVLIVVVVAGTQGWNAWQNSQRMEEARAYEQAVQAVAAGNADQGVAQLAALADGSTGHAVLARLRQAAVLLERDDVAGALELYRALAEDAGADQALRDIARVLYALHGMDTLEPGQVQAMVAPLDAPDGAFRFSAREVKALLALRQGQEDAARDLFAALAADTQAPRGVRGRANEMLVLLGGAPAPAQAPAAAPGSSG